MRTWHRVQRHDSWPPVRHPEYMVTVDVSGQLIAAEKVDGADPPVVLVAQLGTAGSDWYPVIDHLATGTTVVTYDRPGIGQSPPRPAPNPDLPYSAHAEELAGLLDGLGVTQPVVLVGHSIGSLIARLFAHRYPQRVAGMVHVDGSSIAMQPWPDLPPEFQTEWRDGEGPAATRFDIPAGRDEVTKARSPVVPRIVLVRTQRNVPAEHYTDAGEQRWQEEQALLAERTGAALIVALDASHMLPRDAPALVAYAVDEVVRAAREGHFTVELDRDRLAEVGGQTARG